MLQLIAVISKYALICVATLSFCVGLKFRKRHRELSHLYIYALASASQSIIYTFLFASKKAISINISIHIFLTIELSCIFFFFYKTDILTRIVKEYLLFMFLLCICFYVSFILKSNLLIRNVISIYYKESLIVLIPCFIYLFQLFLKPPILNLLEEPSFWFNAGLLIYFVLTFPIFFMISYFIKTSMSFLLDIVNYIGYILIFSFLIRAYLCRPKITI